MDKNQVGRYSKAEFEVLKKEFGGDDTLLYKIRNVLLQFSAEAVPMSEELSQIVKKAVLPELDPDIPLTQQVEGYVGLNPIQELMVNPGVAGLHIQAKDLQLAYLKQQFEVLHGATFENPITLTQLRAPGEKSEETRFVEMLAFLKIVPFVDNRLNELKTLAGLKEETEEERKKRDAANSTK
jgi:hypothetical protein